MIHHLLRDIYYGVILLVVLLSIGVCAGVVVVGFRMIAG